MAADDANAGWSERDRALIKAARKMAARHMVRDGDGFKLSKHDPGDVGAFVDGDHPLIADVMNATNGTIGMNATGGKDGFKAATKDLLAEGVRILSRMQDMLYAQNCWSLLLVFQAMDAAGKDGAIKHVMSGINPQGCSVHSFKAPSAEELDHDFMWRCTRLAPRRGMIGIFNRSYYEEVLVVRVHREYLAKQQLPRELVTDDLWDERFKDIRSWERYMARNCTIVRKFFLNVSRDEQKKRFLERIDDPRKELEVQRGRCRRARALGRVHACLRGHDPQHRDRPRPVERGARLQQVVHAPRGRRDDRRRALVGRSPLSRARRSGPREALRCARAADGGVSALLTVSPAQSFFWLLSVAPSIL